MTEQDAGAVVAEALLAVQQRIDAGDLGPAMQVLEALVQEFPECDQAWHLLGKLALEAGDIDSAMALLAHASKLMPEQADYLAVLCRACVMGNQIGQALACYHVLKVTAPAHAAGLPAVVLDALRPLLGTRAPSAPAPAVTPATLLPLQSVYHTRFRAIYQEVILHCALSHGERWWDHQSLQGLHTAEPVAHLRELLRVFMLRRSGDYKLFMRLSNQMDRMGLPGSTEDRFLMHMAHRYGAELARIQATVCPPEAGRRPFMMDVTVWGAPYIDKFLQFCVPSLLAPGNLDVLCGERQAILLMHTDAAGEKQLRAASVVHRVQALGLELRFMHLDPALLEQTSHNAQNKYWHLGMVQSLGLYYAQSLGADFHAMFPDTLFARGYFENLLRIADSGVPAILQTAFRTEVEALVPAISAYQTPDCINVAPADLLSIALNCLHRTWRHVCVNSRPDTATWPAFHALMWESEDSLSLISPHLSAAYLSHEVLAQLPERFYFTVDSEIDKILPDTSPAYFPTAADQLGIIELSPAALAGAAAEYLTPAAYAGMFWYRIENLRHLDFYDRQIVFPLNPALRQARLQVLPEARIQAEMNEIRAVVLDHYPVVPPRATMDGLLALHSAEVGVQAEARIAELRQAVLRIWHSGRNALALDTDPAVVHQIARMLWHFDLLPEAQDALRRASPDHFLIPVIGEWLESKAANVNHAASMREALHAACEMYVLGATVWGDAYLDFFLDYHLPALLAEGNLPYLAKQGKVILSVVTDTHGRHRIESAPIFVSLLDHAELHFTMVSAIPSRKEPERASLFYMHYGLLDHHHVLLAQALGANLLLLPVDTVISSYGLYTLASTIAAGNDCCTIAGIESYKTGVNAQLSEWKQGHVLSATAEQLSALAMQNKTRYFHSLLMDGQSQLNAYPREFFWRVPGGYVCHSIFMHPLILSARVMRRPFHPNHENTDWALIPRVLQGSRRIKVLDDSLGLFILHCSEDMARTNEMSSFVSTLTPELGEYLLSVHEHDYPVHRHLFRQGMFFPADDPTIGLGNNYLADTNLLFAMFATAEAVS